VKQAFSVIIVLLTLAVSLSGCTRVGSSLNGSGKVIDQDYKIAGFNSIHAKGKFDLEITRATIFNVTVSTDDNLINRIQVTLDHQTLKFDIEAPATFFPTSLKVQVEMPSLQALNLSLGAKAVIKEFKSRNDFFLFLTQESLLTGVLEAGNVSFDLSEGSQLKLAGKAQSLDLNSRGASKMDLGDFLLETADVNMKEKSEAVLNVSGKFDAVLNDNSKIYYLGNPLFYDTSISGGSTMIHK
jgi:hypothetical protein